jgi:hypothetical protein
MHEESAKTWWPSKEVAPLLKAALPTCALDCCGSSLLQHAPRFSPPPTARGLGPTRHASRSRAEEAKPPRSVHATARRLQALLHFCPDQRAKGRAAMQAACNRAKWAHLSDFQRVQHGGPGPRVMQPVRRLLRVSNCTATHATTAPPRLRSQYRDSRQPCSASQARRSNAVKIGPAVMAVTGGQKQRSRRQPSSRPVQGQRGSPLPRREDGAPVTRPSNGSRTRNGCPANHSPCRINSAAGRAAPQAGETSERFDFAIMSASKKVRHVIRLRILFLFLFLSLTTGTGKGGYPEKDPSP